MNLLIDIAAILQYENIALWVLFGLVILLILWSILRGSFRGWAYGTYRLIFYAVMVAAIVLTLDKTVSFIGDIDLSAISAKLSLPSISFNVQGVTVSAELTSLSGTLSELISQLAMALDIGVDPIRLVTFASGAAFSLLKFVLVILYGILLATLGRFLCWFFWHIAFKFIVPKSKRKLTKEEKKANSKLPRKERKRTIYKKLRGVSMLQEVVINLVIASMVFVPITGTIHAAINSFTGDAPQEPENGQLLKANDDTFEIVQSAIDTYQNSFFSKAFFNWTKNADNKSWDTQLLSFLTKAEFAEDVTFSIVDVISDAAKIGKEVIESNILSSSGTTFDKIYLMLTTEYGKNIINAVAQSKFVMTALPLAAEFAMNLPAIKEYVGNKLGIDYYAYNWSATIGDIAGIIQDMQDSDFFTFFTDVNGEATFNLDSIASLFSADSKAAFMNLFDRFAQHPDEKNFFNDMVTVFLVNNALNAPEKTEDSGITIDMFLPETDGCTYEVDPDTGHKTVKTLNDAYKNLSLGDELKIVYSALCDINDSDDRLTAFIIDSIVNSDDGFNTNVLLDIIVDNVDEITKAIAGDPAEPTKTCLMDCTFVTYGMPAITDLIGHALSDAIDADIDLTSVKNELFSKTISFAQRKANAKSEMRGILGLIKAFITPAPVCKEFITHLDTLPGITFEPGGKLHSIDPGLIDGFISLAESIDNSKILSAILPAAASSFLTGNDALASLGIDGINVNVPNFGHELASLLRVAKSAMPLIQFIMTEASDLSGASPREISNVISGLADYHDELVTLLNGIVANRIINDEENTAYRGLIQNLFGSLLGGSFTVPANVNPAVENQVIADLIYGLGTYTTPEMLSALMGGGSISLGALDGVKFSEILKPLDSSEVFGGVIADLLDQAVIPMLGNNTSGISFKNVTSWAEEGQALDSLIRFGNEIGDLSNIDFFGSDPSAIANIIKALSQSQIFDGEDDEYLFGSFFHSLLVDNLGSAVSFFEDRNTTGTTAAEKTVSLKADMVALTKAQWEDEADAFGAIVLNLIKVLGDNGLDGTFDFSSFNGNAVRGLLYSLAESKTIGRPVAYHLYEQIGSGMKGAGMDIGPGTFGYMNIDWIWDAYDEATNTNLITEMDHLADFFETAMDPCYGLVDADGNFTTTGIDIADTSGRYLLAPLTKAMATSIVFNTIPDGTNTPTAFESMVVEVILKAQIYGSLTDDSKAELLSYAAAVSPNTSQLSAALASNRLAENGPWAAECDRLGDLGDAIVNLAENLETFNPSAIFNSSHGGLLPMPERMAKFNALQEVLEGVNNSKLLYRFLPIIMSNGIASVSSSLGTSIEPNYYYMGKGISADPYGQDEIENLCWIVYYAASAEISDMDIAELDAENTTSILSCFAKSHIFNSVAPGETYTFFDGVMASVFAKDEISSSFYYADNPKDNPAVNLDATYTDSNSKALLMFSELFPALGKTADCDDQINLDLLTGDSHSLKSFILALQNNPDGYEQIVTGDVLSLDSSVIETFAKELANNPMLADIFTNSLAKAFNESFSSLSIKMSAANPYYIYWMGNDGTVKPYTEEPDFSKTYDDGEIEILAEFAPFFTENSHLFDSLGTTPVDDDFINTIKDLLVMLNSSYIFHEGGAWTEMGQMAITSWQDGLTVFEQAYGLLIKESGLGNMNFDVNFDAQYSSAEEKIHHYIQDFSRGLLDSSHTGNWLMEIDALTNDNNGGGLVKTLLNLGIISDSMSMTTLDLTSYDPNRLGTLLKAINAVDIIKDVMPYQLLDLFDGDIGFNTYSTYSFTVDADDSFNSLLELGEIGFIKSFATNGVGTINVSYTTNGVSWTDPQQYAAGSTVNVPNAYAIIVEPAVGSSLTKIVDLTVNTAEFFMSQNDYGEEDGALDSVITLFEALYSVGGGSYPAIDPSDPDSLENFFEIFPDVLEFIDDDNGFYTKRYSDAFEAVEADEDFTSRDIFFRNILKATMSHESTDYTLDLARYFNDPLKEINDIFEDADYDGEVEGDWFAANFIKAEEVEFILSGNLGAITVELDEVERTLVAYHTMLEGLAVLEDEETSEPLFDSLLTGANTSMFATAIMNGMARDLLKQTEDYATSGVYFKDACLSDPNDDAIRKSDAIQAVTDNPDYISSFDAVNVVKDRNAIIRMMNVVRDYGFKTLAALESNAANFQAHLANMDADELIVDKFFYNAAIYDYMANRNIYHGEITTPIYVAKLSIPSAFASGFTFASVGALAI